MRNPRSKDGSWSTLATVSSPTKRTATPRSVSLRYAHQQDDEWLNTIIRALDVDYTKEFALTPEYLDLYTKDQLLKLAKEAKCNAFTKDELSKKTTLIDAILKRAPKGFVPKDFQKAGRVSA